MPSACRLPARSTDNLVKIMHVFKDSRQKFPSIVCFSSSVGNEQFCWLRPISLKKGKGELFWLIFATPHTKNCVPHPYGNIGNSRPLYENIGFTLRRTFAATSLRIFSTPPTTFYFVKKNVSDQIMLFIYKLCVQIIAIRILCWEILKVTSYILLVGEFGGIPNENIA